MRRLLLFLSLSLLFACEQDQSTASKKVGSPSIETIKIEYTHSFFEPPWFTWNLSDQSVLVEHVSRDRWPGIAIIENQTEQASPNIFESKRECFYFHLDSIENYILRDSILNSFVDKDFRDTVNFDVEDGGSIFIMLAFDNDSIHTFQMTNASTENQSLFIQEFFETCKANALDSISLTLLDKITKKE